MGLGQSGSREGGTQHSILVSMAVGDVFDSGKLDATPATAFSGQVANLGVGLDRLGSADTGPALPTMPGDPAVGVATSGSSPTTQNPPAASRGLVRLPCGDVVEVPYSLPTRWTGPSIPDLLRNSRLI